MAECIPRPELPCRANLDLMPEGTPVWMYAVSALAFAVFLYGVWEMVHVWRLGKPWKPGGWKTGLRRLVTGVASHRKFRQDPRPGLMHGWVFYGFVMLFVGTTIVAIDYDVFEHLLGSKLLEGSKYLAFEAVLDLFGVVFLVGLGYQGWRRYRERPAQLHPTQVPEARGLLGMVDADAFALQSLFLIGLTGFLLEGLRLQLQVLRDGITYAPWSFVGNQVAHLFAGWSQEQLLGVYPWVWGLHFLLWSAVLAVLPWTKLKHIVTSSLNLYFHDPRRQSRPELPTPFSLQKMLESGATDVPPVGYATIRDLTWKDRLSLDACTNCGRCEAQCPATAAGRPLSPRKLIQDLKAEMWRDARAERAAVRNEARATAAQVPHAVPVADAGAVADTGPAASAHVPRPLASADGIGAALQEATLWSCTTCRACVTACPVDIEHVDLIAQMRRSLVLQSRLDENQQKLIVNVTNAGNPYGFPASDRADWMARLPPGVVVPTAAQKKAKREPVEWLWWVGCSGSFDPRNQQVTVALATLFAAAKLDVAILGAEERCNGDPVRRLGEEGLFQQQALGNIEALKGYGVTKVVAQCPHCFSTLANEYPEFGAKLEVVHHTQLLERLLTEGKIPLKAGKKLAVTYHDSCYLMRHNGIGDAPRNVLQQANGLPVLEMAQSRKEGLCCGAGGANMWYEVKPEATRINVIRAKQAADTGAAAVATACPFCLTMMSDGLSLTGQEGKMQARDLAEIVLDHLDWTPPAPPAPAAVEAASDAGSGGGWSG